MNAGDQVVDQLKRLADGYTQVYSGPIPIEMSSMESGNSGTETDHFTAILSIYIEWSHSSVRLHHLTWEVRFSREV